MKLETKKVIVEELQEKFSKAAIVILTDYKGLSVLQISDLRRKLKEADVDYQVVKNTLLRRASENTNAARAVPFFKGPSAVAISYKDPVAPAKILIDFMKDSKKLEVRVGVLGTKLVDVDGLKALASLPSREVLLSQLLSVLNGVPTGLVRALSDIQRRWVTVLTAIRDQKDTA